MTTSRTCPNCGHQQSANSPYCADCGSPMPGMGTGQLPVNAILGQGRYIILRRVGQGGMGAVYQAADTRLGNKAVAIKEMSDMGIPNPQQKQQAIDAFRQEAQMLAHLDHPNLPKVTDFFSENNKHYIVMEFVQGETLEDTLKRQGQPVAEAQARALAAQLFDVLDYLHRQNPPVIFRDLKPANVMVTPTGQIKLIDFGIARLFKVGKPGDTRVMGTPGYAAPEQHGTGQTDARSDIYSLGVVLHQALTGYDPSITPFALPIVRQMNPSVSPQMEQAIVKATRTDQLQRFQSVDQFRQALAAGVAIPGGPTAKMPPATSRSVKMAAAVAAAVILALLAFLGVRALRDDNGSTATRASAPIASEPTSTLPERAIAIGESGETVPPPAEPTATPKPRPTDTPPPTNTPRSAPTDTPPPPPTATPIPTATPLPEPQAVINADEVNLRRGTGSDFDVIRKLFRGDQVRPISRNEAGDWLQVQTANGDVGWVASQFLDLNVSISGLAAVATPAIPACGLAVDGQLAGAYSRGRLGCPTDQARVIWSARQPFERGAMLWRQDTNRVTVFYGNGNSTELRDQWDQVTPGPSRGPAPDGRRAPERGFGWIWGTRDEVFNGLGWALDEEKGVCALVQSFERGYALRSTNVDYCNGNYNRANDPGFSPIFLSVDSNGGWRSF